MENIDDMPEDQAQPALLSPVEARVAACLMEKELITPDSYPLTIHSLMLACNQKSSRDPVMHLTEGEVGHIVMELAERGLVDVDYSGRAKRVAQRMNHHFHLDRAEQAVLALLMLRLPQTLNDIRTRTERMVHFDDPEAVLAVVDALVARDPPLAVHLPKGPGQREDRYTQLICGKVAVSAVPTRPASGSAQAAIPRGKGRIDALEARVAELEDRLEMLLSKLE